MTDAAADDRTLVERVVAARDDRAFAVLFDRHTPFLYRFAQRLTGGDDALTDDVVHDAWVRAATGLARFEWRSQLRTWLAAIVVQCVRARRREDARSTAVDDAYPDDAVAANTPDWATRVDLERAIAALPPRYRDVVVLHDIHGYTHDEIAGLLDIPAGTSKSHLSRAREALRRALAPDHSATRPSTR